MICTAAVPSDTYARKAQRLLSERGYACEVIRSAGQKEGCGFSLRISGDCAAAGALLRQAGIPVRSMGSERGNRK